MIRGLGRLIWANEPESVSQGQGQTLAVSSMPKAFMTASVVFKVGLPFSLNER